MFYAVWLVMLRHDWLAVNDAGCLLVADAVHNHSPTVNEDMVKNKLLTK